MWGAGGDRIGLRRLGALIRGLPLESALGRELAEEAVAEAGAARAADPTPMPAPPPRIDPDRNLAFARRVGAVRG